MATPRSSLLLGLIAFFFLLTVASAEVFFEERFNVMHRKFDSGVLVIQNKSRSEEEIFARIRAFALKPDTLRGGISPSDAAMTLGIAPAIAKEHLLIAESKGLLCKDISPEGFRFYINVFKEIDPNNIYISSLSKLQIA